MIIDCHAHVFSDDPEFVSSGFKQKIVSNRMRSVSKEEMPSRNLENLMPVDQETFVAEMDEAGIEKTIIMGLTNRRFSDRWIEIPDKLIADWVKKYPDRFIGLASTYPLDVTGRSDKKKVDAIEKAIKEYRLKGVKIHATYNWVYPNDKQLYPAYRKAEELDVPFYIHASLTADLHEPNARYSNPMLVEDVCADFPDLKIVVCHLGVPWTKELLFLMRKFPNLYTDISALCPRPTMLCWDLVMAKELRVMDRVMFGTDGPGMCRPAKTFVDWCKNRINQVAERAGWPTLSKEEIDNLMGQNAMKLFRL
jgi:hypothetical protein